MIKTWLKRRRCFHHDPHSGKSYLRSQIIDPAKLWWCTECGRTWVV